ncbi:hypothetical protein Barb4_01752 [Bacteroidales bacterium Barb4]|nr:hypothetical protein Barb4_01752 [Bacteroidales bacterium Barb4]
MPNKTEQGRKALLSEVETQDFASLLFLWAEQPRGLPLPEIPYMWYLSGRYYLLYLATYNRIINNLHLNK